MRAKPRWYHLDEIGEVAFLVAIIAMGAAFGAIITLATVYLK